MSKLILFCCVLHNLCIDNEDLLNDSLPESEIVYENNNDNNNKRYYSSLTSEMPIPKRTFDIKLSSNPIANFEVPATGCSVVSVDFLLEVVGLDGDLAAAISDSEELTKLVDRISDRCSWIKIFSGSTSSD
ncbi:Protein of unknown function [Cotesia congregata]|uniref:Uncharacterized protein n=1 Tax=Cotesia congregata TaxID=51543 RepID=A0A8J2HTG5_COTCN|nr:Protein of unknown function [Cotesia congregata]